MHVQNHAKSLPYIEINHTITAMRLIYAFSRANQMLSSGIFTWRHATNKFKYVLTKRCDNSIFLSASNTAKDRKYIIVNRLISESGVYPLVIC